MRRITVHVSVGLQGCDRECTIEVEDNATDEEIEELARDAMFELIEWSWWPYDPTRKRRR